MILGVGVDLVSISRIRMILSKHGDRFKNRIFSPREISDSEHYGNEETVVRHFAKRFAAKEAYVKAIGIGFNGTIKARDISVYNNEVGKPFLLVNSECSHNIALSMSDDGEYAIAFVTLYS